MTRLSAALVGIALGLVVLVIVSHDLDLRDDARKCLMARGVPVLTWEEYGIHGRKVVCIKATVLQYVPM